jgi:hypothetical protein
MKESKLAEYDQLLENINNTDAITKKIKFNRETIRKLKVMVANEFFDKNLKNDDFLSEMLEKIVNEYFEQYIDKLK